MVSRRAPPGFACLLLALLPATQPATQVAARQDPGAPARIAAALRHCEQGRDSPPEFLEDVRAAPGAALALLRAGALPPLDDDEGRGRLLAEEHVAWLLAGMRRLPRAEVLALAGGALEGDGGPLALAAALRLYGCVGEAGELERMLELARPDPSGVLAPVVAEALRRAAGEVLARDPRAFTLLNARWRALPPAQLETLVEACRAAPGAPALGFLGEALAWRAELVPEVLAVLQELGRSFDAAADARVRERVRPLLDPARPECRAAVLALGALGDQESIPALIALLGEEPGLRTNARWALRELTGLALPPVLATWERWLAGESSWLRTEGRAALARLSSDDAPAVLAAARALAAHPLAREPLARSLAELLRAESAAVRALACRLLPELGDTRALPGLVALLEDEEGIVAAAALEALRRLTGRELPPEREVWAAVLRPD